MLMRDKRDNSSVLAAEFIAGIMDRFGLGDRWALHALHDDGRCYGMSRESLRRLYGSAALLINLHGGTNPTSELGATDRLVYLETDPVQLQLELHHEVQETIEFLEPHRAFFTFAENWGNPDCKLPLSDRFEFRPTRQPVVVDLWSEVEAKPRPAFTTVANWKQGWRDVTFEGERYTWSKHHHFLEYLDLPSRAGQPLELALSSCGPEDRRLLEEHGWRVRDALEVSRDLDSYRAYVASSRGELTVAKEQNVRLRTGWFSDRSATYLAAGRPVVTEETGFSNVLPTGAGLFAFGDPEEAADAAKAINADYRRHREAASELAREWFSHEVVLGRLLGDLGVELPRRRRGQRPAFPRGMVIAPTSRRPVRLPRPTVRTVMRRPVPASVGPMPPREPTTSIVVVTRNNLVFTRLCLESVLANTAGAAFELIVVDNGSRDGTARYLARLAEGQGCVSALLSASNAGFPAACNRGLALARGEHLVLLNNDTMVPPGWLSRLIAHLRDPAVGLAGPVTNRIGNEAEIAAGYTTWGEFLRFAARRARVHAGEAFDVPVLAMFCLAMRRDVHERLGPLDERFGVGLLEDDDYAERARRAGYRLRCAEDVVVHHFGEASFGKLISSGAHMRLLRANQRRFEQKWGSPWKPYRRRHREAHKSLTERIRRLVEESLPPDARILVVSRGDEELVKLPGRRGMHFPQANGGQYAGHYPAGSEDAVAHLEELRAGGAEFLVIPRTGAWWLDYYEGLRRHLESRYRAVATKPGTAVIFELNGAER
jgi:GT2 family glycosyltransferase